MTLNGDVRLTNLQAYLSVVQPFDSGSDASGRTTIGLLTQVVTKQGEGQRQTTNGLDQIMCFLGFVTNNLRREAIQQLKTLLLIQFLKHRCTTDSHMCRNRRETRCHQMCTIGTTDTKSQ